MAHTRPTHRKALGSKELDTCWSPSEEVWVPDIEHCEFNVLRQRYSY